MRQLLTWVLIGGGIGAATGYFGQCTSGTCPLTASWKRGAIVGAVLGLVLYFGSGGTASSKVTESSANVQAIEEAEFTQLLKSDKPVVVDFYAPWCGPCRQLSPMLEKLAGQFTNELKVVKLNVDNAPALARQYNISGIPALKFFSGGREVGGMVGLPSEKELEQRLRDLAADKR